MKKHLFLLGSFMTSSLVASNTLLVIGCQKKASVKVNKEDEKNTQQVELEVVAKLKNEIRNIIDDVITNPVDKSADWVIDLMSEFSNEYEKIIKFLNGKVEEIKNNAEGNQQVQLEQPDTLESNLIDKIKDKFASLKYVIKERINQKGDELGVSNFDFELNSENIVPFLTSLNGIQVMEAIAKLKLAKKPTWYDSSTADDKTDDKTGDESEEINKIKIDLFKVKTDLSYNFSFGSIKEHDTYSDAELLMTKSTKDLSKIRKYTRDNVKDILTNSKEIRDIVIYTTNDNSKVDPVTVEEIQKYEYIGKQMDWDFSKQVVRNEIATMQSEKFKRLKGDKSNSNLKDIVKEMEFNSDSFQFKIDPSNYMKFDNYNMDMKREATDCIFMCGGLYSYGNKSSEAIKKVMQQFFSDNETDPTKWNGGKINHGFMEQITKEPEEKTSKINLSEYFGFPNSGASNDMLIGYGTMDIRRAKYAGISVQSMTINTNLISPYDIGMDYLYTDFAKYIETYISAIRNEQAIGEGKDKGIQILKYSSDVYFYQWRFGNEGEWDLIQNKIANLDKNEAISFDWIMENVLYKKRIEGNPLYKRNIPENVGVSDKAKTYLKSVNKIAYVPNENQYLIAKGHERESAIMYIRYGPFTVYLNDNDSRSIWRENNIGITPEWS